MNRPTFNFYNPAMSPPYLEIAGRLGPILEARGHKANFFYDGHVDWSAKGLWLLVGDPPRLPDHDTDIRAVHLNVSSALCKNTTWREKAANLIAYSYSVWPGLDESEFRGHRYKHVNHFVYNHLGECESREAWLDLGPGDVFIDVGAAIGSWTLPAAVCGATVYALEPGMDGHTLRKLIQLNNLGDRVILWNNLASDVSGQVRRPIEIPWVNVPSDEPLQSAETVTIDSFALADHFGMGGRLKLIKIDVDGHEMAVLRGAKETIRKLRPRLVVEIHDFLGIQQTDVTQYLDKLGYDCQVVPKEEGFYHHCHAVPR